MNFFHNHSQTLIDILKVWSLQIGTSLFISLIDARNIITIFVSIITGGLSAGYTIWKWRKELKEKKSNRKNGR